VAPANHTIVFAGRAKELSFLQMQLGRDAQEANPIPIINVWGPHGVGKTALIHAFLSRSAAAGQPVSWLRTGGVAQTASLAEYAQALARSLQSAFPSDDSINMALPPSPGVGFAPALVSAVDNTGLSPPADSDAPASFPSISDVTDEELARVFIQGLKTMFEEPPGSDLSGRRPAGGKLWIVLDPFDDLSPAQRRWLGGYLRPALERLTGLRCGFLLASLRAQAGAGEFRNQSNVPVRVLDLPLLPLSLEETSEVLRQAGFAAEHFASIFQETEGWPARLVQRIEAGPGEEALPPEAVDLEDRWFAEKTAQQKEWLLAAAFLSECKLESLSLFGGTDSGRLALAWLQDLPELKHRILLRPGVFVLESRVRQAWQAWAQRHEPQKADDCRRRAEVYRQMLEMVPSLEHRQQLALLAPFQYFTPHLVEEVLPSQAKMLRAFVANFPRYFQTACRNLTVLDSLKPVLKSYAGWIDPAGYQRQSNILRNLWQKKRASLVMEIEGLEKDLAQHEEEKQVLFIQIQALNDQIYRQKEYARPIAEFRPAPPARQPHRNRTALAPLLLEISGVVSIYVGILSIRVSNDAAISYIFLGLYLIVLGMFMPTAAKTALQTAARAPATATGAAANATMNRITALRRRIEENINHLRLQTLTFENKRQRLTQQLAKTNQALNEAYQALNESYV
jgi:hypothetical protein